MHGGSKQVLKTPLGNESGRKIPKGWGHRGKGTTNKRKQKREDRKTKDTPTFNLHFAVVHRTIRKLQRGREIKKNNQKRGGRGKERSENNCRRGIKRKKWIKWVGKNG